LTEKQSIEQGANTPRMPSKIWNGETGRITQGDAKSNKMTITAVRNRRKLSIRLKEVSAKCALLKGNSRRKETVRGEQGEVAWAQLRQKERPVNEN